jgi:hypothetical protein
MIAILVAISLCIDVVTKKSLKNRSGVSDSPKKSKSGNGKLFSKLNKKAVDHGVCYDTYTALKAHLTTPRLKSVNSRNNLLSTRKLTTAFKTQCATIADKSACQEIISKLDKGIEKEVDKTAFAT